MKQLYSNNSLNAVFLWQIEVQRKKMKKTIQLTFQYDILPFAKGKTTQRLKDWKTDRKTEQQKERQTDQQKGSRSEQENNRKTEWNNNRITERQKN
jgi:hypothetical protein